MGKGNFKLPIAAGGNTGVEITRWERPTEWLTMPTIVDGEQKIAMLIAVFPTQTNDVKITLNSTNEIDWGDGTIETTASSTREHRYDYASIPATGETELGYRQVILTITPSSGNNLTSLSFGGFLSNYRHVNVLEIKMAGNYYTDMSFYSGPTPVLLQNFDFIGSCSTPWYGYEMFRNCKSLIRAKIPSETCYEAARMFYFASGLRDLGTPDNSIDFAGLTGNMSSLFLQAFSIEKLHIILPTSAPSAPSLGAICQQTSSLKECTFENGAWVTDLVSTFLDSAIKIIDLSTFTGTINLQSVGKESDVEEVILPIGATINKMLDAFYDATQLKVVRNFSLNSYTGALNGAFNGCDSLQRIIDDGDVDLSSVTTVDSFLSVCSTLEECPSFTNAPGPDSNYFLTTCQVLPEFPIKSYSGFSGSILRLFASCYALNESVVLDITGHTGNAIYCNNNYSLSDLRVTPIGQGITTVLYNNNGFSRQGIVNIFNDLSVVTTVTHNLNVSGNPGSPELTAGDIQIATDKGWTVAT